MSLDSHWCRLHAGGWTTLASTSILRSSDQPPERNSAYCGNWLNHIRVHLCPSSVTATRLATMLIISGSADGGLERSTQSWLGKQNSGKSSILSIIGG